MRTTDRVQSKWLPWLRVPSSVRRWFAVVVLLGALDVPSRLSAQVTCPAPRAPRPSSGAVTPEELAVLPGSWRAEVIATRGRWGLNSKRDSLGRATVYLQLAPVDTAGAAIKVIGIRPDSLRPVGGRYFAAPPALTTAGTTSAEVGAPMWMFGRTLYKDHPGGSDAQYDAFELLSVDSLELRGRFFRSWGIVVPTGVSGDSVKEPAGFFCARRWR